MRILEVFLKGNIFNLFVKELCDHFEQVPTIDKVMWDHEEFVLKRNAYDIVHIHWPEYTGLPRDLDVVDEVLGFWRSKSKIVVTRHNALPHDVDDEFSFQLYQKVYESASAIVHLGSYSLHEFCNNYPNMAMVPNLVIPHHIYPALGGKNYVNPPQGKLKVLSFGAVRTAQERSFLIDLGIRLRAEGMKLVIPIWDKNPHSKRRKGLSWIKWELSYLRQKKTLPMELGHRFVKLLKVEEYYNRSSVCIVNRPDNLNSGAISQAFQFGRIAVGSNNANIGDMLNSLNNPTFKPNDVDGAMECILNLHDYKGLSRSNHEWAWCHLHPSMVASRYIELFQKLLK